MNYRRVLVRTGSRVHLSEDTMWHTDPPGQWPRGYWTGQTLCGYPVTSPPDLPVNAAGEVEPTADTRPVDCSRCRRYAERFIENIGRVLLGEW